MIRIKCLLDFCEILYTDEQLLKLESLLNEMIQNILIVRKSKNNTNQDNINNEYECYSIDLQNDLGDQHFNDVIESNGYFQENIVKDEQVQNNQVKAYLLENENTYQYCYIYLQNDLRAHQA